MTSAVELGQRMWRRLSDPALAPFERLFFEIYGQALQGSAYAQPLLDGVVEDWLGPVTEYLIREGREPAEARAQARLGLAATRRTVPSHSPKKQRRRRRRSAQGGRPVLDNGISPL